MDKFKGILVYCEKNNNVIIENSLELLSEAKKIKSKYSLNPQIVALAFGNLSKTNIRDLKSHGADLIVQYINEKLENYRPDYYAEAITNIVQNYKPEIVLIGATLSGEEIGPIVAKKLNTGIAAHCTELKVEDENLLQVVAAFGGMVLVDIKCSRRPQIATIKAGIMKKVKCDSNDRVEIEEFNKDIKGYESKIEILEVLESNCEKPSLNKSELILGGGYGIKNINVWEKLERLSKKLNGAIGCTRPIVDEKWASEDLMIGTSGVAVKPKVYLNFGISGTAHHICGIKDAGTIISVNNDKNAEIFKISDFKVIDDAESIIDSLLEKL